MQYDLTSDFQRKAFLARCHNLLDKGAVVELTEKAFRTPNQNRYLHLLLGIVAMETGNRLEDVKREYFKRLINPDIFMHYRTDTRGIDIAVYRSITVVSKQELSTAIDRFRMWGAENGIYMPSPDDREQLSEVEYQMGRMKSYL